MDHRQQQQLDSVYKAAFVVPYPLTKQNVQDDEAELKKLNAMVFDDEVFKSEFDQETPLRAAFVDREIWYFHGGDPFPYEWDEEREVIERALLNRGEFACQQKDRFRKNMDNIAARRRKRRASWKKSTVIYTTFKTTWMRSVESARMRWKKCTTK